MANTYLSLYASGFIYPGYKAPKGRPSHDLGDGLKLNADARFEKYSEIMKNGDIRKLIFIPTDDDVWSAINNNKNIKRIDIYSHAWDGAIGLGGFTGKRPYTRKTGEKEVRTNSGWDVGDWFDFDDTVKKIPVYGQVPIDAGNNKQEWEDFWSKNKPWRQFDTTDALKFSTGTVLPDCEIYFWGCNSGGTSEAQAPYSIAQAFASKLGCKAYAFCGGGGAMFITKSDGKTLVFNGNMITANISLNNKGKDLSKLDPTPYFKKFPL